VNKTRVWWFAGGGVVVVAALAMALRPTPAPKEDAFLTPRMEGDVIVLPPTFMERAGIEVADVGRRVLRPVIRVVGTVDFDPEHVADIGTRIRGLVRAVRKMEGDAVKAGEVLAEIQSAELSEAQSAVQAALAHKKAAELNAARERELAAKNLTTTKEAELAEAALREQEALLHAAQQRAEAFGGTSGSQFGVYFLKTPISGTVVERRVALGQSVENYLIAYRVANLDRLWVELAVFERDIEAIAKGDKVEIHPTETPAEVIEGHVAYVGEVIHSATRSTEVRVEVNNERRALRPGQSVVARIVSSKTTSEHLVVPSEAVVQIDGKPVVFVVTGKNRVVPTHVTLGVTDGAMVAVSAGLFAGQQIAVKGTFALKSELFR
jgi:cobalt-zinc-cadmium efflux system membrane fusion protein